MEACPLPCDLGVCPLPCDLGACPLCCRAPLPVLAHLCTRAAGPPPRDREPAQTAVTGPPRLPLQVPPPHLTGPRSPRTEAPL